MNLPEKIFSHFRKGQSEMAEVKKQLERAKSKMPTDIVNAHSHSSKHRSEILASKLCACFYCIETFRPDEITDWVDNGDCALCPKCGIDAVLGDRSGYPLNTVFLQEMHKHWFVD